MDPHERNRFPDPVTLSLAQGKASFFPVFFQMNSYVSLPGEEFIVPLQDSTHSLALPRQVASFNASALPETNKQALQTLNTHRIQHDTHLQLNSWDEKDNSR